MSDYFCAIGIVSAAFAGGYALAMYHSTGEFTKLVALHDECMALCEKIREADEKEIALLKERLNSQGDEWKNQ